MTFLVVEPHGKVLLRTSDRQEADGYLAAMRDCEDDAAIIRLDADGKRVPGVVAATWESA